MFLRFAKLNPNGNITILALDPVPRAKHAIVAEQLMHGGGLLEAEQVGFLEDTTHIGARARLQMMGGEFCGNATLSMAAYLARSEDIAIGEERNYTLEVSGADDLISCQIKRTSRDCFEGQVPMPLPEEILQVELLPGIHVPLVRFAGITHAILPEINLTDAQAEELLPRFCKALDADAMGFIFTNNRFDQIRPLVYVCETNSCVWENGCGSGTAALGAWRAVCDGGNVELCVQQPCPENRIRVSAAYENGRVRQLRIGGKVELMALAQVNLEE